MSGSSGAVTGVSEVPKGTRIEVESEGDWWDAEVVQVKQDQVKVHYAGGTEAEQEWIPIDSGRIRLAQDSEVPRKKRGPRPQVETVEAVAVPTELPFKTKKEKEIKRGRGKFKAVKKIIEEEGYDKMPIDTPTYTGIEAPPSLLPAKKYCDLTGLEAKYTDPSTRLRYFSSVEYAQVRQLSDHAVEEFLRFRNATVNLK